MFGINFYFSLASKEALEVTAKKWEEENSALLESPSDSESPDDQPDTPADLEPNEEPRAKLSKKAVCLLLKPYSGITNNLSLCLG
jgi:hypothetical protein